MFYAKSTPAGDCTGERLWGPCMMWGWLVSHLPWGNGPCNSLMQVSARPHVALRQNNRITES